jgi:prepilin-type N-terminal cleavage/methylation domain-containing protein
MTRRAFTLIELLVVIGIIGLLAALLFPVLGRARAAGRTAACLGNLHQISLAIQMEVDDGGGRLPTLQNRASITDPLPALDTELIGHVDGKRELFQCPADDRELFETTRRPAPVTSGTSP